MLPLLLFDRFQLFGEPCSPQRRNAKEQIPPQHICNPPRRFQRTEFQGPLLTLGGITKESDFTPNDPASSSSHQPDQSVPLEEIQQNLIHQLPLCSLANHVKSQRAIIQYMQTRIKECSSGKRNTVTRPSSLQYGASHADRKLIMKIASGPGYSGSLFIICGKPQLFLLGDITRAIRGPLPPGNTLRHVTAILLAL